ncbi:PREDICTED: WD repeat-containing protein mio-B [Papilio xuthus]|uniref:WD repeat-containing protein mio-B n=1 Tax=Papilio xuthus TaxID=66420 RepID=A0AAJ7EB35_PAPXU|nr:PREDICTED: WD repeat-containing protein mio-B [Papilio xuthus]
MSGTKLDILWSPVHHDKFIVWGPDITLYEVAKLTEIEKKTTFSQISSTRGATVVASQSASGVRCVDISAIADHPDPLLALGHASGRVTLASLKQTYDPLGLVGREFVPKYGRPCNGLSWSHDETNLIAVALDKHRSDNCIQVWDANRSSVSTDEFTDNTANVQSEPARPIAELALSETAHSVAWTDLGNRTLAASMNMKHIKIYDLREQSGTAVGVATSRQCLGVCAARRGWQLASRGEAGVCVWDARALACPLLTLPSARPPRKIQWCPTRRNLLLSLQRDSSTLRLHDIQHAQEYRTSQSVDSSMSATPALEEGEEGGARGPSVLERDVSPAAQPLAAFCWHPAHEARLLALCLSGGVVEYTVCERVTVAWGARGGVVWAGGGALRLMRDDFYGALQDVSHRMQRRAATDYGLKPDLWQNADLAEDEALSGLWHFLALSKSLVEDGCFRNSPWKLPGVRTVLRAPGDGGYRSEAVPLLLPDMPNRKVTVYRSAERTCALQLCGWGWGWENAGVGVERAEAEGTPCRAAALAAFHLRTRAALDVLARAQEPRLRVAALVMLALAGPGADERLWRDAMSAAAPALPDAYLRALLHFLAATASAGAAQPDLSAVLNETEMRLEDRVAFACIFLPDGRLQEYVRATCEALTEQGDLAGILLTGVSPEGVALLQRWVEATGDVQSAALLAARCCPADLLRDRRVSAWLESYRTLLDGWRMWWARCALDTCVCACAGEAGEGAGALAAARRVGVACNYCGKCVAAPAHSARPRAALARLPPPANKMKISSCPNCRKPLPRCGVCLLHLGTGSGFVSVGGVGGVGGGVGGIVGGSVGVGGAQFGGWFSWCVACRHGGHAAHLLQWFSEHSECPVSSCSCRCSSLDPPDQL